MMEEEPPFPAAGGGELKHSGMEQGGERWADPGEASSRMGVEVRTGCRDVTSAGEDSLVSAGRKSDR